MNGATISTMNPGEDDVPRTGTASEPGSGTGDWEREGTDDSSGSPRSMATSRWYLFKCLLTLLMFPNVTANCGTLYVQFLIKYFT